MNNLLFKSELESILLLEGNMTVKAYYKYYETDKFYYDFIHAYDQALSGAYDYLCIQELIWYVEEQNLIFKT